MALANVIEARREKVSRSRRLRLKRAARSPLHRADLLVQSFTLPPSGSAAQETSTIQKAQLKKL